MKTLFRFVFALSVALISLRGTAEPSAPATAAVSAKLIAAVTAADDERQAAVKAGDRGRLDAILSDGLRYAHSNGKIDTKASYVESLTSHQTVYENFDYKDRTFLPAAPGVVLMTGRVLVRIRNGEQKTNLDLNFLSVWREEKGHWRFLAWQSCKNPAPSAGSVAK
jgi:hypothetical protein